MVYTTGYLPLLTKHTRTLLTKMCNILYQIYSINITILVCLKKAMRPFFVYNLLFFWYNIYMKKTFYIINLLRVGPKKEIIDLFPEGSIIKIIPPPSGWQDDVSLVLKHLMKHSPAYIILPETGMVSPEWIWDLALGSVSGDLWGGYDGLTTQVGFIRCSNDGKWSLDDWHSYAGTQPHAI